MPSTDDGRPVQPPKRDPRNLKTSGKRGMTKARRQNPVKIKQVIRATNARIVGATKEVEAERHALARRMAEEARQAVHFEEAFILAAEEKEKEKLRAEMELAEKKRELWPLSEARNLVRNGYTVKHTVRRTGWPKEMLDDVKDGVW